MFVGALAICFVIEPAAFVHVAAWVDHPPKAIDSIVLPISNILMA